MMSNDFLWINNDAQPYLGSQSHLKDRGGPRRPPHGGRVATKAIILMIASDL